MIWLWMTLGVLVLLDGMRLRRQLVALQVIPSQPERSVDDAYDIASCAGVHIRPEELSDATAFAKQQGLDVLDLVPSRLSTRDALHLAQHVDVPHYRRARFAIGFTSAHAVIMSAKVSAYAAAPDVKTWTRPAMFSLARRLKRYASTTADMAVVRGFAPVALTPADRLAWIRQHSGVYTPMVLGTHALFLGLFTLGALMPAVQPVGWGVLLLFHLQPLLVVAGTPLRPKDIGKTVLLRLPQELWFLARVLACAIRGSRTEDAAQSERRRAYEQWLSRGLAPFFETRRETCPLCDASHLKLHLCTRDLLQGKPGEFRLERCLGCGHIFQNPRLSQEGLDFYYRDFYDGAGEEQTDAVFSVSSGHGGRLQLVTDTCPAPRQWLDVGAGHGHFCADARAQLPDTRFHGLDLSDSIQEAARRGWIDRAIRGLFPDFAEQLNGQYDVVSMHHYLEHTIDPRAELQAAHRVLAPDGLLIIELPDPASKMGRVLGRYWVPWFQPQHLHLLSLPNLQRLLEREGFRILQHHSAEAHQSVDWLFAVHLLVGRVAAPTDLPWHRPSSVARRMWRAIVCNVALPMFITARLMDLVSRPLLTALGQSNTFRVLAQKNVRASVDAVIGPTSGLAFPQLSRQDHQQRGMSSERKGILNIPFDAAIF